MPDITPSDDTTLTLGELVKALETIGYGRYGRDNAVSWVLTALKNREKKVNFAKALENVKNTVNTITLDELAGSYRMLSMPARDAETRAKEHFDRVRKLREVGVLGTGSVVRTRMGHTLMKLDTGVWQRADGRKFPEDRLTLPLHVIHKGA